MPGTVFRQAGQHTPMRATFMPRSASGIAQPTITSPIRAGPARRLGHHALQHMASRSSGRTLRNMPLRLATGVRVAATM